MTAPTETTEETTDDLALTVVAKADGNVSYIVNCEPAMAAATLLRVAESILVQDFQQRMQPQPEPEPATE